MSDYERFKCVVVSPVTSCGAVGYDKYGQFQHCRIDERDIMISHIIRDVRGQTCLLCGNAWQTTAADLGDQMFHNKAMAFVHASCCYRLSAFNDRCDVLEALTEAELVSFEQVKKGVVTTIKNQYDPSDCCPWYQLTLPFTGAPVLTVGARRRVHDITIRRITTAQSAVIDEALKPYDVTKIKGTDCYTVHAWTQEAVVEYLSKIREAVTDIPAVV